MWTFQLELPKPVDVNTQTVEELQEILEDKLAALDVVPHADNPRTPAMSVSVSVPVPVSVPAVMPETDE